MQEELCLHMDIEGTWGMSVSCACTLVQVHRHACTYTRCYLTHTKTAHKHTPILHIQEYIHIIQTHTHAPQLQTTCSDADADTHTHTHTNNDCYTHTHTNAPMVYNLLYGSCEHTHKEHTPSI